MNRAERRRIAKKAPRGSHKFVQTWLKDRCPSCLIGDHRHCHPVDGVPCACGCARVRAEAAKEKEKQGEEETGRRLWRPWSRSRS